LDVAFFAGIVNKADGDFIAGRASTARRSKGKRIGVQSIGGGVWSMAMLAIEHLGLEPSRDKMTVMIVGDSPVLAQSLESAASRRPTSTTPTVGLSKTKVSGSFGFGQGADTLSRPRGGTPGVATYSKILRSSIR
jgi:hypothetical protein